ncbi:glycosyltransferase family 4 protein [Arthrobacter sp. 4R501]|uniref:glycosyltransferase family 4 protein n=1 Tax=Arthrobacter sp. 4R501 TaxID=2058886 RepID=UPI000CE33193|nr:glycosyltransferase family 4 protein [Arthrobacter sp. 4R501]
MTNPRLRVTIIGLNYAPEPSGNAPYTSGLAEGLAALGHRVTVITGYPHYPEWRLTDGYKGWSSAEEINGVNVLRLRHHVPTKPAALSRLHMELSFGLRSIFASWDKPDVVLFVSPALFSSGLAIIRARLQRRPAGVGIWIQDIYSRGLVETGMSPGPATRLATWIESRILRSTNGVVAIHDRFKNYIVTSLGVSHDDVTVIRNWTHLPPAPDGIRDETRARLGWKDTDLVVLHSGNMGKKQGLENVLAAARLADSRNSRVRFVLMGDGNQRAKLEQSADGIQRVQFVPSLPDAEFQAALVSADLLLVNELPGVTEMAVPSKLTSYFNSGVPIISATDEGSVTAGEIATSGGGIRVDPGNPAALLEAAETLGQDGNTMRRLGAAGLRFRHETLSEAVAISKYDDFITSLASSRGL